MSSVKYLSKKGKVETAQLFNSRGETRPKFRKLFKELPQNILELPNNVFFDKTKKRIVKAYTSKEKEKLVPKIRPSVLNGIEKNPNNYIYPRNQVIDLDARTLENASVFKSGSSNVVKGDMKSKGWGNYMNSSFVFKQETMDNTNEYGLTSMFYEPKKKNDGATMEQIYKFQGDIPTDFDQFVAFIRASYENDFTAKDRTRATHRVLLLFGTDTFRWFNLDELDNLDDLIENYETGSWGSEVKDLSGENAITTENLDMSYFRINLTGAINAGCEELVKNSSRYWFLENTPSKDNQCLEACIRKGLNLTERTKQLRKSMVESFGSAFNITMTSGIEFKCLRLYEQIFEVNIEIYADKRHTRIKEGVIKNQANMIRKSKQKYDITIKLLYREGHFNLIKAPKKTLNKMTKKELEKLGVKDFSATFGEDYEKQKQYNKEYYEKHKKEILAKANENYVPVSEEEHKAKIEENQTASAYNKFVNPKQKKSKKKKEICVFFDNETVFDKWNENLLQVYGVAWFVWDMEKPFDYNEGWNEDKSHNYFNEEPYCYYSCGKDCINGLIKFLVNPPDGVVYKPIGFNNSRFDNFSLCAAAKNMGLLTDIFVADGSILYCRVEGGANAWDACRFLTGQSLDSACKSYKTNPKKLPDLINHYEIQCYYETNGMDGLVKLLHTNDDYILYNKIDCICLCDLVLKMKKAYQDMCEVNILEKLTISSLAYSVCEKLWEGKDAYRKQLLDQWGGNWKDIPKEAQDIIKESIKNYKKFNIIRPKTFEDDENFRKSLMAGRTQSFYGKIDLSTELAMVDYKSLYPTIMGSYINDYPMPYGDYHKTDFYNPLQLGIYRCDIKHQRCLWKNQSAMEKAFVRLYNETGQNLTRQYAPNVIARREKDKPLDWFYRGEINDIWLTSCDIECLRWATEDEDCVRVYEGYFWDSSRTDIFSDFLEPMRVEKTRQDKLKEQKSPEYNPANREVAKGLSNASSGKMLEKLRENTEMKFTIDNYIKMEEDEKITDIEIMDYGGGLVMVKGLKTKEAVFTDLKENKKKPSHLGMFIYSNARTLMYKSLLSQYLCLYMDTDSACMPLYEWERCKKENENNNNIETGQYGCLEEEVCFTDEDGVLHPANRLIGIAPKNYAVLNDKYEFMSKRKFKGVRKSDVFLPLSNWGSYDYDEKGNLCGEAYDKVKLISKNQEDIRRIREFNCCPKCIDLKLMKNEVCEECVAQKKKMKKAYSTEMFEYLVNGKPIVIFCSMLNKIVSRTTSETSHKKIEELGNCLTIEQLETICEETSSDDAITFKLTSANMDKWKKFKKDWLKKQNTYEFGTKESKAQHKKLLREFMTFYNRFNSISNERKLEDCFVLKQAYMIKMIK